ncbi:MAG: haloacid dehalogenase-like hydrolase [Thauera sp.]|nr:haloacid dehalogenase-like hydrolase [Thauera sp.]
MGLDKRIVTPPSILTVADFDGTLISGNSFPLWIRFVAVRSLTTFRFRLFVAITAAVLKRKIFCATQHGEFKRKVDSLSYPDGWAADFVNELRSRLHADVLGKMASVARGPVLIATAAPSCYARAVPAILPLPVCGVVCSQQEGADYIDNTGATKRDRICAGLSRAGSDRGNFILFTDHEDDLPTAIAAVKTYLCHPSAAALQAFKPLGGRVEVLG